MRSVDTEGVQGVRSFGIQNVDFPTKNCHFLKILLDVVDLHIILC